MQEKLVLAIFCIGVGGLAAQWVAWRFKLPAIVLLFATGLIIGPMFQLLRPSHAIGPHLQPLIGLAVAIVVFEGGLALDFRELRAAGDGVRRLTIMALPICFVLGSMVAHFVGRMSWGPAALYGAITVVTGPTVVLPLLRHTRLQRRSASFLKWEAIVNDPIGAILATVVLEVLLSHAPGSNVGLFAIRFIIGLLVSLALGIGAGLSVRWLFMRDQAPEVLKTPLLLVLALAVYALSNLFMDGAGLLAATMFGVAVTNLRVPGIAELRRFKESLVVLLVSTLFVVLTADLDRQVLARLSWPIIALTLAMLFAVRPLAIALATLRSDLTLPERLLAGWIAPRGIVAAAVAGLAGLRLQDAGYPGANLVMPAVFALIAATMILHGFSLGPLGRYLRLTLADQPGLAIIGASPWATEMARLLNDAGLGVLLIDTFPGALDTARRLRIPHLQAEILSEHGDEELQGRAIDYVLAATQDEIYNGLVCARLAPEIGRQRVFQLAPLGGRLDLRRGVSRDWRGRVWGAQPLDYDGIANRFEQGWIFEIIEVGEGGMMLDERAIPLLVIRRNATLAVVTLEDSTPAMPGIGDRLVLFRAPSTVSPRMDDALESVG